MVLYNRPYFCGGHCVYCFRTPGITKSTTLNEDTELARLKKWSAREQLSERVARYGLITGKGLKYDIAVKGDSFAAHPRSYLREFMKDLYDYLNGRVSGSFEEAVSFQADAPDRCVTVKCETRPDQIDEDTCLFFEKIGVTTVELGVQSLDDDVLATNRRGHGVAAVEHATSLLKNYGFEVVYQVMVGLPGGSLDGDERMLTEMLWEPRFCPDALKIYPCLLLHERVARHSGLTQFFLSGRWKPIDDDQYSLLLSRTLPKIPPWNHVNRIQRLMNSDDVRAGPRKNFDRSEFALISRCLWQRSVAQKSSEEMYTFEQLAYVSHRQGAAGWCVEAVTPDDTVVGYGRLQRVTEGIGIIRDVRVLGMMLPVGAVNPGYLGCQHRGVGSKIVVTMEGLARINKMHTIRVRPSPGSVRWFEKLGYKALNDRRTLVKVIDECN